MKVKIGNTFYDSGTEPIMIVLSTEDKENISKMGEATKYCSFPGDKYSLFSEEYITNFMETT